MMIKDEFVELVKNKREIEFTYNTINYGIDSNPDYWYIFVMYKPETTIHYYKYDDLLNHKINGKRIIDICEDFEITSIA